MTTTKISAALKATANKHRAADAACGRSWVCACGACRIVRAGTPAALTTKTNNEFFRAASEYEELYAKWAARPMESPDLQHAARRLVRAAHAFAKEHAQADDD